MFGDSGHAIIMACFGLWMVVSEKKIISWKSNNEIFNIFFAGRYIIFLMGLFSFYTGFIYNDIFSKSLNIFQTRWFVNASRFNPDDYEEEDEIELLPKANYDKTPYIFGTDPVWQISSNKIIFLNSYKMKLSIIFGVTHMIFVTLKKYASILLEFLPQLVFLLLLFLYLVVMMFMKWIWYSGTLDGWDPNVVNKQGTSCAPSVLIYFINMMLMGESEPNQGCDTYMYEGQRTVQFAIVACALVCIPIMLLGKPLYILSKKNKKGPKVATNKTNGDINQGMELDEVPESSQEPNSQAHHEEDQEDEEHETTSDLFIYQGIHTIEYVLSTISHTASYLRLWALSLAHAQLSEVLWSMMFHYALILNGYVGAAAIYLIFACWAAATVSILVLMEGLSAFLHTLRLHWVEFMSKFYTGLGYAFQPFSFKYIIEEEEAVD
ncbi:hypothetical protein NQ318_015349 [Aromia moschata]|uniref:V-type proton ATPase subunit a n=1 Tax=Aromia moschata TaxID=1265417 RepID=A0AAV8YMR9_9CUCU|nr:hypothetical protein NQ318_015349 [Aromia moschata]